MRAWLMPQGCLPPSPLSLFFVSWVQPGGSEPGAAHARGTHAPGGVSREHTAHPTDICATLLSQLILGVIDVDLCQVLVNLKGQPCHHIHVQRFLMTQYFGELPPQEELQCRKKFATSLVVPCGNEWWLWNGDSPEFRRQLSGLALGNYDFKSHIREI